MRILYVENHSVFAKQATTQFLSAHETIIVPSLKRARESLLSENFDLALVDYDLDDGKGAELVAEIRKKYPKLPIVGASSHEEGNQALLRAGAHDVCSKMDFDEIGEVIRKVLSALF